MGVIAVGCHYVLGQDKRSSGLLRAIDSLHLLASWCSHLQKCAEQRWREYRNGRWCRVDFSVFDFRKWSDLLKRLLQFWKSRTEKSTLTSKMKKGVEAVELHYSHITWYQDEMKFRLTHSTGFHCDKFRFVAGCSQDMNHRYFRAWIHTSRSPDICHFMLTSRAPFCMNHVRATKLQPKNNHFMNRMRYWCSSLFIINLDAKLKHSDFAKIIQL